MATILLVIEDDPIVARLYQKALAFDGFKVETALGGKEGLAKVKSIKPDIVLCDVMMPEPNGMDVLLSMKKDPATKYIPVVMLTNLSGKNDAELAMSRGADDYWVKKDSNPRELGEKIKAVLAKYQTKTS